MPLSLKSDPSRTAMIRKAMLADWRRRVAWLVKEVNTFLVVDDMFGLEKVKAPTFNRRDYQFLTDDAKITEFNKFLKAKMDSGEYSKSNKWQGKPWEQQYIDSAYKQGMLRSYVDVKKADFETPDWYLGSKEQFLMQSFGAPASKQAIALLYTRQFNLLQNYNAEMALKTSQILADGFVRGDGADTISRAMRKSMTDMTKLRADRIVRTEIVRAHAEGQLRGFEALGVDEIGILAEWSVAGDDRVCPLCADMDGKVMTVEEAHGLIPFHVQCRCAWIPANVGEKRNWNQGPKKQKQEKEPS